MKHIHLIFVLSLLCIYSQAENPDSLKMTYPQFSPLKDSSRIGWEISANFGVYQANKHQAQFYNGSDENVNNLKYILSNYYWYQDMINQLIQYEQRDSFLVSEYPSNIKYDAAMHVGFSARYNFTEEIAFNVSFNYSKLQVRDVISFQVIPAFSGMVESYVYGSVFGIEGRTNIDVGGLYTFHPEKKLSPFAEMGLHLNSTHVKKHFMKFYDKEFNLVNVYGSSGYIPNAPLNEYAVYQGGVGFGTYLSGGVRYMLSHQFTMELAANVYLKTVNLEGYSKKFGLHGALMLRLVMSPFINLSAGDSEVVK